MRPAIKRLVPLADTLAKQVFGKSRHKKPNWRHQGDALRNAKNWREAAAAYRRHLDLVPEDTAIWIQLGHMLKEAGDSRQAIAAYERSEDLDPNDADRDMHLAHLRRRLAEPDPFGSDWDASRNEPGDAQAVGRRRIAVDPVVTPGLEGGDAARIAEYIGGASDSSAP